MALIYIGSAKKFFGFHTIYEDKDRDGELYYSKPSIEQAWYSLVQYRTSKYSIYIRDSGAISRKLYILGIFSRNYWIATICLFLLVMILANTIKFASPERSNLTTMVQSNLNFFTANGTATGSNFVSFKLILLSYSVLNLICSIALVAFLSTEQVMRPVRKPFKSLSELIDLGSIPLCINPKSDAYDYIRQTEHHPNLNIILNSARCPKEFHSRNQFAAEICQSRDRIAFVDKYNFASEYNLIELSQFPCAIVQIVENIYSFPLAITYRPGFPFKEDFNRL